MATKSSWAAVAKSINEMKKAAWAREVQSPYIHACQVMNVNAMLERSADPTDVDVVGFGHEITLGGECFRAVRSLRGTWPAEGLHAQKQ